MTAPLVEVRNLTKTYVLPNGDQIHAVDAVSFSILPGQTLGLVGESGCGKSTLGRTLMRLVEPSQGSFLFEGEEIFSLDATELKHQRQHMQMIFQDPYASLNPRMTVEEILLEPFRIHKLYSMEEAKRRVIEVVDLVNLPQNCFHRYPHEFSGGQRQRIGIARALSLKPKFIICDEPISSLDVSIQSQIVNLLLNLQKELNLTYLFIAHDLAMVKVLAHNLAVMYRGKFVEIGSVEEIYTHPQHEYTQTLLNSILPAEALLAR